MFGRGLGFVDDEEEARMGWRYKAGLVLIGFVVIIWVTSAEITQVCPRLFAPVSRGFVRRSTTAPGCLFSMQVLE